MKKSTISKLKSIFGSKKGKRQSQHQQSAKSSRSPSPESVTPSASNEVFQPIQRTPTPNRVGPPPSPPVPTQPIVPVAPEPSGPLPLMPCLVCGRTFVPQSLAKHVKICEKMTIKKRKTFDSSRQRREGLMAAVGLNTGTDLEQYLPKNFGLPENSPFLEKSPPPTAKPTLKPKPQSVRSAITKPMAELQKCPHCGRAFGVRAFERHVEWCADKAKILPAAPAHPPPHIADAKQRLNARTQYKAPLARGRKTSQSRDKSSNSRSTSVDSSRGVSPPPPRDCGDYGAARSRASESASSNDCHEDAAPHVPVIRTSRGSRTSSSGDAGVRARQARLARDITSSRNEQDPSPSPITSNKETVCEKHPVQNKLRSKLTTKRQQQLQKLEEIGNRYNERTQKQQNNVKAINEKPDKSLIPKPKHVTVKKENKTELSKLDNKNVKDKDEENIIDSLNPNNTKQTTPVNKTSIKMSNKEKKKIDENKKKLNVNEKKKRQSMKESSMSLDSLEETPLPSSNSKKQQSVGINTELLCVPCVIHDAPDESKNYNTQSKFLPKKSCNNSVVSDVQVEMLYENPVMMHKIKTKKASKELPAAIHNIANSTEDKSFHDSTDSIVNLEPMEPLNNDNIILDSSNNDNVSVIDEKYENEVCKDGDEKVNYNLCVDNIEENYTLDLSDEDEEDGNLERRHGSGETYTKFTENPADLEEFMNITDKMLATQTSNVEIENQIYDLSTPQTNSIEALNNSTENLENPISEDRHEFSETFDELKKNFKMLLDGAGDNIQNVINKDLQLKQEAEKKVCDMEHIIVYELNNASRQSTKDKEHREKKKPKLSLPDITQNNKTTRISGNKKRMQKICAHSNKNKMFADQTRSNKEYQTFIIKKNNDDNSDGQSVSSEAPPLKLPRIENKSSSNMMSENLFPSSVKRSTSLLDSIQKKTGKLDATKSRIKTDQLEQDLMQSLKDFDKFYEFEKNEKPKQFAKEVKPSPHLNQKIEKRDHRNKFERKTKKMDVVTNGNYSSNGKTSNDSAYSSLNRISPSKLSICTKDTNGLVSLEQIPAGSDSGGSHKEDARSISSEEFLAMERSTELEDTTPDSRIYKETDAHKLNEKRVCSRNSNTSGRSPTWKPQGQLSSSSSEASLHQARRDSPALAPRLSRFCHECGSKFPVETAKFCIECGVKRLAV
ncbi:probable serine/threonine-protein kinase nek3 isoform X2 [Bombyx mori]|uniref:C2HC/C3H-type domain-containing protein n=1 Tax=Bombyx mori TaxID=7091 RepID=A0A8R2R4Z8_BOMMO|nr:probable serine/threonine-protein kinase nek3 isoform X2 [Bombyx mori]